MKEATIGTNVSKWGNAGKTGICMQGGGLLLETVADLQKGQFKRISGNRNRFCNVGVWNFFSHPNYLGEMVFWVGTFLGGVACNNTMSDWSISIAGLLFILTVMKGACDSLDSKHIKNYGHDEEYLGFRKKRCFVGPVPSILQRRRKLSNVQQYNLPIK
jgi:steroid 5-alpha reductase family enzyme